MDCHSGQSDCRVLRGAVAQERIKTFINAALGHYRKIRSKLGWRNERRIIRMGPHPANTNSMLHPLGCLPQRLKPAAEKCCGISKDCHPEPVLAKDLPRCFRHKRSRSGSLPRRVLAEVPGRSKEVSMYSGRSFAQKRAQDDNQPGRGRPDARFCQPRTRDSAVFLSISTSA